MEQLEPELQKFLYALAGFGVKLIWDVIRDLRKRRDDDLDGDIQTLFDDFGEAQKERLKLEGRIEHCERQTSYVEKLREDFNKLFSRVRVLEDRSERDGGQKQ